MPSITKTAYKLRGYYFGEKDRAAFVDVNCMQHVTHDFSEPEIDDYFGGDDKVQKLDVLHLETMNQYVVYWIEDQKYAVNNSLYAKWGISYRGKILVFKRRSDAMRFSTMRRYHVEQVMECVKCWLNGRESIARV